MDTDLSEFRRERSENRSRREGKDCRSRDKDRIKTKDGFNERDKVVKDSRERDSYSDKRRGEVYGRDEHREKKRNREDEHESNRGRLKEIDGIRGKDRGREKEKAKTKGKDKEQNYDEIKDRHHALDGEKHKDYIRGKQRELGHGKETSDQDEPGMETKERVSEMKGKRKFEGASEILSRVVNKSRKLEEKVDLERQKANQRCRILDEQDNVDDDDDAVVKVLNGFDKVLEGGSVVLTLKDQEILAGGNVNESIDMLENVETGEQKCRNDKFNDQSGEGRKMLLHYDDPTEEEGVTLDVAGRFTADKKVEELCRNVQIPSHRNQVEDLNSSVRISSEYYTPEEMLQFKKPKKKKSLRKREKLDIDGLEAEAKAEGLGASDLRSRSVSKARIAKEEQENAEAVRRSSAYQAAFSRADKASRALRLEQTLATIKEEHDTDFFAEDLQKSLERARKLALKKQDELDAVARLAAAAVSTLSADAPNSTSGNALDNKVVFSEMEELVWGLRSEEDEALEASEEIKDETGGWAEVLQSGIDEPSKSEDKEEIIRDDTIYEAPAGKGLSVALKLLKDRGTLKETVEQAGRSTLGGIHDVEGPKEINLERRDEYGRVLTPKEAYRLLCHKFHGKGPGKRKRERWIKQYQDELKLKQMTSSDVLPHSVERMREAMSQSKTPYIVLSGHVRPR